MSDTPSKRLRLRFFAEDEQAIAYSLESTVHSSQSNVIRAALALYEQIWSSKRAGFNVVYRREGAADLIVLEPAFTRGGASAQPDESGKRAKTEKSVEIRVTPSDYARIETLMTMEAGDTYSTVVRRAIRLYALVVSKCLDGWTLVAVSPSGDVLALTVPGLGAFAAKPPAVKTVMPIPGGPAAPAPFDSGRPVASSVYELLPLSLRDVLTQIASLEETSVDMLLVDMLHHEVAARLGESDTMPDVPQAPEPEVIHLVETVSPVDDEALTEIEAAIKVLDDNIRTLEDALGEQTDQGQQSLFSTLTEHASTGAQAGLTEPWVSSPTERILAKIHLANKKIEDVLALAQRQKRPRTAKRGSAKADTEPMLFGETE